MDDTTMLSTRQVADLVGCTYRQLDYWARTGTLVPEVEARGQGSVRRYTVGQVRTAMAVAHLARIGVEHPALKVAADQLGSLSSWFGRVIVDETGNVWRDGEWFDRAGRLLDLDVIEYDLLLALDQAPALAS